MNARKPSTAAFFNSSVFCSSPFLYMFTVSQSGKFIKFHGLRKMCESSSSAIALDMPAKQQVKQSGFVDRLVHYMNMTDPRTIFHSDENVREAEALCLSYDQYGGPKGHEYARNKKIVDAAVHPVTNEIIPRPFRVSAIAPVSIPLVFAMISCPAANVPGTMFLHWLTQSYNTACNYANRAGADQSVEDTAKAYGLAVTSACAFAYGLGKLTARGGGSGIMSRFAFIIPCVATAMANVANVGFTRADEIINGAAVRDEEGTVHGLSQIAGKQGVFQTAMTRCVLLPCSCFILPPIAMTVLRKMKALPTWPKALIAVELGIIYLAMQATLPAALAVFPQSAKFPVSRLEPQFHNLLDKNNSKIQYLYANKGL